MTWFNPARWALLLALCGSLVLGYFAWRTHERSMGAAPYIQELANRAAVGKAAQDAANEKAALDRAAKRRADDEVNTTLAAMRADVKRMRDARSGGDYLPPATPSSSSPERACFDRAELEHAVGRLDRGVQGLTDQGSTAITQMNALKRWANP